MRCTALRDARWTGNDASLFNDAPDRTGSLSTGFDVEGFDVSTAGDRNSSYRRLLNALHLMNQFNRGSETYRAWQPSL